MRKVKITGYGGTNWLKQVVLVGQREKEIGKREVQMTKENTWQ